MLREVEVAIVKGDRNSPFRQTSAGVRPSHHLLYVNDPVPPPEEPVHLHLEPLGRNGEPWVRPWARRANVVIEQDRKRHACRSGVSPLTLGRVRLGARIEAAVHAYRRLTRAGVRRHSVLLYPLRRRWPARVARLDLLSGESIRADADEPLIPMFDEIWVRESYLVEALRDVHAATVVDVGANVGVFALWASRRLGAERIIAAEPDPHSAWRLLENLERNDVRGHSVVQVGVGGEPRDAVLYGRGERARNTLFTRDLYGSSFTPRAVVRILRLEDVFDLFAVNRCDLLKLDCEGAEYEILLQASPTVLERVDHIALEYHEGLDGRGPDELASFLDEHGFEVTRYPPLDVEGGHMHASRRR